MQPAISCMGDNHSASLGNRMKKQENSKNHFSRDVALGSDLWKDGLICAFEFVQGHRKIIRAKSGSKIHSVQHTENKDPTKQVLRCGVDDNANKSKSLDINAQVNRIVPLDDQKNNENNHTGHFDAIDRSAGSYWVPIGWDRISELVQTIQVNGGWAQQPIEFIDDEDELTVADVAAPYWERAAGPTWWCHITAGHPFIDAWLSSAHWLHPAISIALRDESRLISERMKFLLYEDRSLRVTHNLAVFGGCGLVLSIITGLFGINVDGIPGASNTPYAFGLFSILLLIIGIVRIIIGLLYLGLRNPLTEAQVEVRKLELEELVKMFKHEAESHAQVKQFRKRRNLTPTAADRLSDGAEYVLIH